MSDIRAAVLADYAEGHPIKAICAEHAISRTTVHRIVKGSGLPPRTPGPPKRPERRCLCGAVTTSKTGECRLCQLTKAGAEESADGIDPDGWVLDRRRRVMVWQPEIERAS